MPRQGWTQCPTCHNWTCRPIDGRCIACNTSPRAHRARRKRALTTALALAIGTGLLWATILQELR
jgi:uncharacterized paraquat-inducible protein A